MSQDVISRGDAWRVIDQLRADERVVWAMEPAQLEAVWRAISAKDETSHKALDRRLPRRIRAGYRSESRDTRSQIACPIPVGSRADADLMSSPSYLHIALICK